MKKSWFHNYTIQSLAADQITIIKQESIVIEAIDTSGLSSPQRTYDYLLNFLPPRLLHISNLGTACYRDPTNTPHIQLDLTFNRLVEKPPGNTQTRILFVQTNDNSIVHAITTSQLVEFNSPREILQLNISKSHFQPFTAYSILLEWGAFVVNVYCRPQSERVNDLNAFRFDFIDDSAVKFQFITRRNEVLGGNSPVVKWSIDNGGVVENCFVKADDDTETEFVKINCTNRNELDMKGFSSSFYSMYVTYVTPCLGQTKFSETLRFRLVNQKPILNYTTTNFNGVYASKSMSVRTSCVHLIACEVFCRLRLASDDGATTSGVQFSSCRPTFEQIQNGLEYLFEMYTADSLGNTGDVVVLAFTADTLAPTFTSPPADISEDCGYDLTQLPLPPVADNFDKSPRVSYTDRKTTSCLIRRSWVATDHVNNEASYTQTISLLTKTSITYPQSFNLSCIDNAQVLKV
jgi:hypothetical protein